MAAERDLGRAGTGSLVRHVGIALVHAWRWTLGLLTPRGTCKYHPSCSQYAIDVLREYGIVRGTVLAGWRLLRCNPWSHGGVDYARDQSLFPLFGSGKART
jgi:putative membrane protein insertion efficiency factor